MTEQGAAADNACREWSAGRRKAPRKSLAPRDPSTALKRTWVPEARRGSRPIARPAREPIARLPAPPGAPFPSFEGKKEKGTKGPTRGPKNTLTGQRSVG